MTAPELAISPDSFHSLGPLLRHLRQRARLSQRELSIAVGYSEAQISRLEQNQRQVGSAVLTARFVPALGLDHEPAWVARMLALVEGPGEAEARGPAVREPIAPPPVTPDDPLLLATKLFAPRPRPDAVARPRLIAQLDRAYSLPLTLIAAPAGFGKTSALASWLTSLPATAQVAWLSLDAGDNDLSTFLRYLLGALRRAMPSVGGSTLLMLQRSPLPPLTNLLVPLLNDLAALTEPLMLVLDDYHLIDAWPVHQVLNGLLDRLPPQLHLVIATRVDPPLPLARLRGRGQLVELRAGDLRFTQAEAATFFQGTMALAAPDPAIALLVARTEGWAAALQLAALALREQADQTSFVASFAGTNRYVVDYLVEEVLDRLPAHLRSFLLQTAIVDRLCGELCDALLAADDGRQNTEPYSQLILAELERQNMFLVPLDNERRWYRYHHLFTDVLRAKLQSGGPHMVAELHRRASAWFERRGLLGEAFKHMLATDQQGAAALLATHIEEALKEGRLTTLRGWLDALPDADLQRHAWLCLAKAKLSALVHDLRAAEHWVTQTLAADDLTGELLQTMRGEIGSIRGHILSFDNNLAEMARVTQEALINTPPDQPRLRGELLQRLGGAYLWEGRLSAALPLFAEAQRVNQEVGDLHNVLLSGYNYAVTLLEQGQLISAERHLRMLLDQYASSTTEQPLATTFLHLELAHILYEWNRLAEAQEQAQAAARLAEQAGMPRPLIDSLALRARMSLAQGWSTEAQASLNQARALVRRYQLPVRYSGQLETLQAYLWIATGNLAAATTWATTLDLGPDEPIPFLRLEECTARAHALAIGGDPQQALVLLARLMSSAEASQNLNWLIAMLNLRALILSAQPQMAEAAQADLARALALAEPAGYVRRFLDAGPQLAALLREAQARGTYAAYCERLLRAF